MGPLTYVWDGERFKPATARLLERAKEQFTVGEKVDLDPLHERSSISHQHFFCQIREAWLNLPEQLAMEFPTVEHFRKRALIMTGFHLRKDFVCASKAEAIRTAAVVRSLSEYALVLIDGNVVTELTADSQAYRNMRFKKFQESKDKVLAWCWGLCGVDPTTGELETGQAA